MFGPRIDDLRRLAMSQRGGGEEVLDQYFEWRQSRALTVAKGVSAGALSLLTAWLIPFLKNEFESAPLLVAVLPITVITGSLSAWGLVAITRMDRIHRSYLRAASMIQLYRRSES